jgi:hypothetical protein
MKAEPDATPPKRGNQRPPADNVNRVPTQSGPNAGDRTRQRDHWDDQHCVKHDQRELVKGSIFALSRRDARALY